MPSSLSTASLPVPAPGEVPLTLSTKEEEMLAHLEDVERR